MVRLLYGLGVLALVGAGVVFAHWASELSRDDPTTQWLAAQPSAVERFRRQAAEASNGQKQKVSPLVVQAEALARYLAPPPVPKKKEPRAPTKVGVRAEPVPARAPAAEISPKFKLHGTSYCAWQAERSLALIVEPALQMSGSMASTVLGETGACGDEVDRA